MGDTNMGPHPLSKEIHFELIFNFLIYFMGDSILNSIQLAMSTQKLCCKKKECPAM